MKRMLFVVALLSILGHGYGQFKISGDVVYMNPTMNYLDSVSVFLKQGANLIGETTTDSTGYYEFNDLSNGTYELVGICIKGWGGSNSNDANAIMKHFIHLQMLEGLQLQSADVDNNQLVNTLDAFMVSKRFIHLINAFPAGDWVVGDATVTVDGYNVIHNLKATCMGDVNSSFSPPAGFICGDTMADARDGQLYPTVLIG
ncbi:MAG: hypothetical protein NTU44_19380, partial [Bacteroidetes bacterium]|nr:hypothetical protein [Bacteroidota bacterium]